jgi:AcrR family transcriptional regulator
MSLRAVAAGCGVSLGLVQYYFPTKAALVAAVDELVLAVVTEVMQSREGPARARAAAEPVRAVAGA